MCTAITLKTSENHHLVGRNFDIHPMNDLSVALVPREFEYVNRVLSTGYEMKEPDFNLPIRKTKKSLNFSKTPLKT